MVSHDAITRPTGGRRLGDVKHVSREVRIVPSLDSSHPYYFLQCECCYDVVVTASECHSPLPDCGHWHPPLFSTAHPTPFPSFCDCVLHSRLPELAEK